MKYLGPLFILLSLTFSCKQATKSNQADASTEKAAKNANVEKVTNLPSIPEEVLRQLFTECDFVDYIFYELPFSMSYDKQVTIQSALRWVNQSTEIPTSGCKALGRMIFQKKGEIMMEAEIYVSDTCSYYKWIKDGKPAYNNLMSPAGINHYMGIIKQFKNK